MRFAHRLPPRVPLLPSCLSLPIRLPSVGCAAQYVSVKCAVLEIQLLMMHDHEAEGGICRFFSKH